MRLMRVVQLGLIAGVLSCGGSTPTNPGDGSQMPSPPPPGGTLARVGIQDFSFSPASLTIKAGTVVRWTNNGPSAHTTTSDNGVWNSGTLNSPVAGGGGYGDSGSPGGTFDVTFTQPGTYTYHCSLHPPSSFPGFTGTITVTP
jgi:plastocyanin